jgi:hypothetical protein
VNNHVLFISFVNCSGTLDLYRGVHAFKVELSNFHSPTVHFGTKDEGKAIPLLAQTGPEDSRRLRLPDFKTIGI